MQINCQTGDTLAREQVEVEKKEQVLGAVGKAASRLRGKLGESLASIKRFDAPVEEATTSSLEALKAFSLAEAERSKGSELTAIPFYKHAIELDPNFAVAYARLGQSYANTGQSELAVESTKLAFERRERASELEKLYISTHYYDNVTGELDKSIEAYQLWKRTYPRDSIPPNNLGVAYNIIGKFDQGLEEAQETMRLDPNSAFTYGVLGSSYFGLNRLAEARQSVRSRLNLTCIHWAITGICTCWLFWKATRPACSARRSGQKESQMNSSCWKLWLKRMPFRVSCGNRERLTTRQSSRRNGEGLKRVRPALRPDKGGRKLCSAISRRRVKRLRRQLP